MSALSTTVKANRDALAATLEALNASATDANGRDRSFTPAETRTFDAGLAKLKDFNARLDELQEAETRDAAAAAHNVGGARFTTTGPEVYNDPIHVGADAPSYFKDLRNSKLGDWAAAERLQRNEAARGMERRAGDMSTTAGQGGQFAPPAWLVNEFVALARAGRVTADLMQKSPLPSGISSINLPKISGGVSTGVQAIQNTAVSDTAMTTTSVTSGITTIAGKQIVSLQLLNQSGIPFDRVILADLAADYAKQLDLQVISGSGASGQLRGLLNGAGVGATSFTTATPKVIDGSTPANSFYNALVRAVNAVATTRFMPAQAIVMHNSRWSWCLEALDSSNRPLILTNGGAFNAPGVSDQPTAQGAAGSLLGLPVFIDPNIPTNLGAGVNEDRVFVLRGDDCFLYESELRMESFDATYADQASVLYRALAWSALITDRFGPSVNVIAGTGLVGATL